MKNKKETIKITGYVIEHKEEKKFSYKIEVVHNKKLVETHKDRSFRKSEKTAASALAKALEFLKEESGKKYCSEYDFKISASKMKTVFPLKTSKAYKIIDRCFK